MRIICILLLLCFYCKGIHAQGTGNERKQMADRFVRDLYKVNKTYSKLGNAAYSYEYQIYSDSLKTRLIKRFPVTVVKLNSRTYYNYLGSEILYDSSFTLVIDHDEKQVRLLKNIEQAPPVKIETLIDTAAFQAMLEKTTHIAVQKKNGITTYTTRFNNEAQLASMSIAFDEAGMVKELSTCTHARQENGNTGNGEPLPVAMVISFKSHTAPIKQHKAVELSTYFKLFGNGRYVLSDAYQTFNLNNLYEKQDF